MASNLQGLGFSQTFRGPEIIADKRQARAQQAQAERANAIALFTTALQQTEDAVTQARERGAPDVTPFVQAMAPALLRAAMAADGGGEGINTQLARGKLQGLLLQPSGEQALQAQAAEKRTLAQAQAEGTAAGTPPAPISLGERVISGSSSANQRFALGIPENESARVEFLRDPDGTVKANVKGRFGAGTQVNIAAGESAFQSTIGKNIGDQLARMIAEGEKSVGTEQVLRQMMSSLKQAQTGTLRPTITALQGLANTFGLSLETIAKKSGIAKLGELTSQEEFNRLSRQLIIDGFEKFNGNLNLREVQLAEDAFANLGRSNAANEEAIAAGLAAATLNRQRALDAALVSPEEGGALSEARALIRSKITNDVEEFMRLKSQFLVEIRGSEAALPEGVPDGSVPVGKLPSGETVYRAPDGQFFAEQP